MRSISFNVQTVSGAQASAVVGASMDPILAIARKARDAGIAKIAGEATPIVAGIVFDSQGIGAALEFSCKPGEIKKRK